VARVRPLLTIISLIGLVYGVYGFLSVRGLVQSWNIFSGDLIAVAAMSTVGLIVIGLLTALDFGLSRRTIKH
jgi:hypothetical protein